MYAWLIKPYLVLSWCDTKKKNDKKHNLKYKNQGYMYYNKPLCTCDTMAQVHSVSQCGKNQNHTHFKSTAVTYTPTHSIPVFNLIHFKCFWHTKRFLAFKIWPVYVIGDCLIWKVIKWHNKSTHGVGRETREIM